MLSISAVSIADISNRNNAPLAFSDISLPWKFQYDKWEQATPYFVDLLQVDKGNLATNEETVMTSCTLYNENYVLHIIFSALFVAYFVIYA